MNEVTSISVAARLAVKNKLKHEVSPTKTCGKTMRSLTINHTANKRVLVSAEKFVLLIFLSYRNRLFEVVEVTV